MTAEAAGAAPQSHPVTPPQGGFAREKLPFIVATAGEFLGLYFWLYFWDAGSWVLATLVLWAGFLTERISVLGWVKYFHTKMEAKYPDQAVDKSADDFKNKPKLQQLLHLLAICLSEISIWVAFVFAYDSYGIAAGFAVLLIGEQLEHSMELGLIAHRKITDYIPSWSALKITLLEAGGGLAWIWLVRHEQAQLGGLFLLLGLTIEHVVQGNKIKVDLEAPFKAGRKTPSGKNTGSATGSAAADGVGSAPGADDADASSAAPERASA